MIIGAGRTGTTWLRNTLAASPRFVMVKPEHDYLVRPGSVQSLMDEAYENPRFVGDLSLDEVERRLAQGKAAATEIMARPCSEPSERERFAAQAATVGVYLGEKSPGHFPAPIEAIRELHRLCPGLRLVVGVREPVSRALSHLVNRGIDYSRPVTVEALSAVVPHSRYAEHLCRWASVFHPSRIILYSFELLREAPDTTVSQISTCLGAGRWPNPPLSAPRASLSRSQAHPTRPPHPSVLKYITDQVGCEEYHPKALMWLMVQAWQAAQGFAPIPQAAIDSALRYEALAMSEAPTASNSP